MKLAVASLISLSLLLPVHTSSLARGLFEARPIARPPLAQTFRLEVTGRTGPDATFWVAYGPLAGHFGMVQLHRAGSNTYAATAQLPGPGRTTFVYVSGHGAVHTRMGWVPGDPVMTIRTIGPVTVTQPHLPTVRWQAPIG